MQVLSSQLPCKLILPVDYHSQSTDVVALQVVPRPLLEHQITEVVHRHIKSTYLLKADQHCCIHCLFSVRPSMKPDKETIDLRLFLSHCLLLLRLFLHFSVCHPFWHHPSQFSVAPPSSYLPHLPSLRTSIFNFPFSTPIISCMPF